MPYHKQDQAQPTNQQKQEQSAKPRDQHHKPNAETGLEGAELPPPGTDPWHDGP